MVKIKDMEKFVDSKELEQINENIPEEEKKEQWGEVVWVEIEAGKELSPEETREMIDSMFQLAQEQTGETEEKEETEEQEEGEKKEVEETKEKDETEPEQEEVKEKEETEPTDIGQEEGSLEEYISDLLEKAEQIGWEEIDQAVQEVQDAIDEGASDDEILQKIAELEEALAKETLANESLSKERDRLLEKLNELQDRLSEYELKTYDLSPIESAIEKDPTFRWFIKIVAMYKNDPDKVGKERLISALDQFIIKEFWISVSDLLEQKAEEESKKLTTGDEKTIEITVDAGEKNPIDEMFEI